MNYIQKRLHTNRLSISYYRSGEGNSQKLLLLHGNLSSSIFFLPLMPYLEKDFDIVAPDMRCFGNTDPLPLDATRGYRDWSDDLYEFCRELGWNHFLLCGWSMGGNVAMQYTIDHGDQVDKLILVCPGSPYGFGGTKDEKGTPYSPIGLGSGGGTANPSLIAAITQGSRFILRDILHQYYFKPPFRMSREWENMFIDAISKIKTGNNRYPGDYQMTAKWPYVIAGTKGVLNAMTPTYGNLSAFLEMKKNPPVLWIRGEDDIIVSDTSLMELGYLGKIGLMPGWPGESVYPPQPMIRQIRYFFRQYQEKGGPFIELVIPGGHMCILESPLHFISAVRTFTQQI